MKKLRIIIITIALAFAVLPTIAFAQQRCLFDKEGNATVLDKQCESDAKSGWFIRSAKCKCCGDCQLSDFVGLAIEVSRFIFGIAGSLALVMFAYGGFCWLTAAGIPDRIEKGRKTLTAAVVGLVIIFGAWVLVNSILAALTGQISQKGVAKIFSGQWAQEWAPQPETKEKKK